MFAFIQRHLMWVIIILCLALGIAAGLWINSQRATTAVIPIHPDASLAWFLAAPDYLVTIGMFGLGFYMRWKLEKKN